MVTIKISPRNGLNAFVAFSLTAVLLVCGAANAQEIPISNTTFFMCQGFITDTGLSAGSYSPNEDVNLCVCPEDSTQFIRLEPSFVTLGAGDQLSIFDGCDLGGDALATWLGDNAAIELNQVAISSEPGGCLSVHFQSDEFDNGSFVLAANCNSLCESVAVEYQFEGDPTLCLGDELVWTVQWDEVPGVDYQVEGWSVLGDWLPAETTDTLVWEANQSGLIHSEVLLNGITEDGQACTVSSICPTVPVVASAPTFENTSSFLEVCEGDEVTFDAAVISTMSESSSQGTQGGGLFIPDDQSQCFSSSGLIQGYSSALISNVEEDVLEVSVNMEHSYMGDLTITLVCPSGQSMTLHEQGGGGTWLGEPVDNDATPTSAGVGYDYAWAPSSTNGTWAENAGGTLPAGTYEATGDWSDLNGCPVAGYWELEICDSWGSDNGFVFGWSVSFLDEVIGVGLDQPDYVLGQSCDSIQWVTPSELNLCNGSTEAPVESGVYSLEVLDSWGCLTTHEMEVLVNPAGCMDSMASNYSNDAVCDDAACIYAYTCDNLELFDWELLDPGWYELDTAFLDLGEFVEFSRIFNAPSVLVDGNVEFIIAGMGGELVGEVPGLSLDEVADLTPGGQACFQWGGVPTASGTYEVSLSVETQFEVFGTLVDGPTSVWPLIVVVQEVEGVVEGCTYPSASNYMAEANLDDGSCLFPGCLDPSAPNFTPLANVDDGSCAVASDCLMDGNLDGIVNTSDLLLLLGEFGAGCE